MKWLIEIQEEEPYDVLINRVVMGYEASWQIINALKSEGLIDNDLVYRIQTQASGPKNYKKAILRKAQETMEEAKGIKDEEFTKYDSDIQTDDNFRSIPRRIFSKGLDKSKLSPELVEIAEKALVHDLAGAGPDAASWILWKDISGVVGEPAVVVEQIQDGLRSGLMRDYKQDPAAKEILRANKNWAKELLADFISTQGAKKIFMPTAEKIIDSTSMSEQAANIYYSSLPKKMGFQPSSKLEGFWEK